MEWGREQTPMMQLRLIYSLLCLMEYIYVSGCASAVL